MDRTAEDFTKNAERIQGRIREFMELAPKAVCRRLILEAIAKVDNPVYTDDPVLFPSESVASLPAAARRLLRSVVGKRLSEFPPQSARARTREVAENVASARYLLAKTWVDALWSATRETGTVQLDEKLRPQGEYLGHPAGGFTDHLHHSLASVMPEEAADRLFEAFAVVMLPKVDHAIAERGEFEVIVLNANDRVTIVRDGDVYYAKNSRPVRSAG